MPTKHSVWLVGVSIRVLSANTLTLAISFERLVMGLSYFTRVLVVTIQLYLSIGILIGLRV
jgi:hypothetical protein